jgi:hypothetical protein
MTREDDLTRAARRATLGQLNTMLHSNDEDVVRAAREEHLRRSEERRSAGSLTGVIKPIDET